VTGYGLHNHIVNVRAARLDHIAAPRPTFPWRIWTQDISHAPSILSPPQSSPGSRCGRMGIRKDERDFSLRVLQADASTPRVPFAKLQGLALRIPIKSRPFPSCRRRHRGLPDYTCPPPEGDCHLSWSTVTRENSMKSTRPTTQMARFRDSATLYGTSTAFILLPGEEINAPARRAGLPIAPLLFNADELALGRISHAIRFILPNHGFERTFLCIQLRTPRSARPVTAPPMGAHFRLKASYDMSRLTPAAQVVARAMQKYGMFCLMWQYGTHSPERQRYNCKVHRHGFRCPRLQDLKVTDFEVLDMGTPIRLTDDCVRNR